MRKNSELRIVNPGQQIKNHESRTKIKNKRYIVRLKTFQRVLNNKTTAREQNVRQCIVEYNCQGELEYNDTLLSTTTMEQNMRNDASLDTTGEGNENMMTCCR